MVSPHGCLKCRLNHREAIMRALIPAAIAFFVFTWSPPTLAEGYQVLPLYSHIDVARSVADHTALLTDTKAGVAFDCSAQFDTKSSSFTRESACIRLSIDGALPSAPIALPTTTQNFGWIPLWSVDQSSGVVTFCTARSTIKGLGQIWCTPVVIRK